MVTKTFFDTYNGKDAHMYTLANGEISVGIIDFGAAVQFVKINTPHGWRDVCLGFDSVSEYIRSGTYCGASVGRVANRIQNASFELDGRRYTLCANEGTNHLHGGSVGFDKKFYDVRQDGDSLVFSCFSRDGEEGYPANMVFRVTFCLLGCALHIGYEAESDRDTLWSPTCHAYFDLDGGGIDNTVLRINADFYTPIGSDLVPTGEIAPVAGTPFDFTAPKRIGRDINADCDQLRMAGGYDHNFVLNGGVAAMASGLCAVLELSTDLPGLQFYSGNFIKGRGARGELHARDAFCLEPQFFPNAVNINGFESPVLRAGIAKRHFICYRFSAR